MRQSIKLLLALSGFSLLVWMDWPFFVWMVHFHLGMAR